MRKVLINLVCSQQLTNIFTILGVGPARVVNIYDKGTAKQHLHLMQWFAAHGKRFGITPEFAETKPLDGSDAQIHSTLENTIRTELERSDFSTDSLLILNISGDNKKALAHCFTASNKISAARQERGLSSIPIIYLDTDKKAIAFASEAELADAVIQAPVSAIRLTISQLIEAVGSFHIAKTENNWEQAYPAALYLYALAKENIYFSITQLTPKNFEENIKKPISSLLLSYSEKSLQLITRILKKIAQLAESDEALRASFAHCGFVARDGDFYFSNKLQKKAGRLRTKLAQSNGHKYYAFVAKMFCKKVNNKTNFWVGGWWEVIVASAYKAFYPEHEVLWSVETSAESAPEYSTEMDIIATDGYALRCISCKRGVHDHVTKQLEQHSYRSQQLSGGNRQHLVAIFQKDAAVKLKKLAGAMDLTIWDADTIEEIVDISGIDLAQLTSISPTNASSPQKAESTPKPPLFQRLFAYFAHR